MDLIERAEQKKKKEGEKPSSLVERAAAKSGNSKAIGVGIGNPTDRKERRPDPSSLNPEATEDKPANSFRGIGEPGAPRKLREQEGAEAKPEPKESAFEKAAAAAGAGPLKAGGGLKPQAEAVESGLAPGKKADSSVGSKKKAASKRKVEEVDLVALREAGYITPDMPPNLMSEEFRIIKRSILLNAFAKGDKKIDNGNVILVTSSSPGEGKTFCAINLALSIATEQDVTVLLVDADFSKPEVLNRLGVSGGRGLMDVVADEEIDLASCLIRTSVPNLVLLPAGRQHNLTTELLASDRMETMAREIGSRYPDRLVIFDSPPVLASSAASVLALYMGQTVFVIEAEKTTEPQIKESLSMISSCENINLILNKTRFSGSNKKFASYYGYGGR
ncbi:XrtA-associated tyrosine autokinase [Kordiimonas aestuarii]|uniref:XrtA-associated tyrosine autokinase n=1 Tax=Kordiimonas aestuarii TaxID=1005925 RepID=UPI0021CE0BDC|nr:XrtA-associated tyrosine autokinase [Kordiimonas aestuarii]